MVKVRQGKRKIILFTFAIILTTLTGVHTLYAQEWYESKVIVLESSVMLDSEISELDRILRQSETRFDENLDTTIIRTGIQEASDWAKMLLSYLVYGYNFTYTPSDALRNIKESWTFSPLAHIVVGDNKLVEISRDIFKNELFMIYRYNLDESQIRWLQGWSGADIMPSGGEGIATADGGAILERKNEALLDAIKVSIRSRLIQQIPNKPLEVKGLVRLTDQPYVLKSGNYYVAKVKIKIKLEDIKEQQIF